MMYLWYLHLQPERRVRAHPLSDAVSPTPKPWFRTHTCARDVSKSNQGRWVSRLSSDRTSPSSSPSSDTLFQRSGSWAPDSRVDMAKKSFTSARSVSPCSSSRLGLESVSVDRTCRVGSHRIVLQASLVPVVRVRSGASRHTNFVLQAGVAFVCAFSIFALLHFRRRGDTSL